MKHEDPFNLTDWDAADEQSVYAPQPPTGHPTGAPDSAPTESVGGSGAAVLPFPDRLSKRSADPVDHPAPTESARPAADRRPTPAPARSADSRPPTVPAWVRGGRAVRSVVTHDRTRTAARFVVRHGSYVAAGGGITAKRAWDSRTTARYERMMRAAESAGDHESALHWEQRAAAFRQQRHQRRMDLITAPVRVGKNVLAGAAITEGTALAIGISLAVADHKLSDVIAPTMTLIEFIRWAVVLLSIIWGPVTAAAPWAVLVALWNVGRRRQAAPAWALPPAEADGRDVVPDEGAILDALRHLGIAPLNRSFKEGWQPRWVSPTVRLGKGWHSQLQLPLGTTVEMINKNKATLAHNLMRKPIEVWPTEPANQPGVLDLWVADQGSLSGKVDPWPLLAEGEADYFKGVPVGVSQRGEPVMGKLMAANYMVGGIMGSGKSSLVVALLLGAMLDRLTEIEVYVMAYNVDYDPMRPRLRTLVKGDDDEQVEAALHALRSLRDEVTQRGKILEEIGGDEVRLTRAIAERDARMRPKVVVFDECHELFEHKEYGPEAAELAVKVMKKARKVGITLIWVTVSPTAASIPKDVTRNTSHRVAFAVGDHVANDGLLGTGKHRAGITATSLNPAENVGTAVTTGFTKNTFELIRAYYVRRDSQVDEVTPVVTRAMALREGVAPLAEGPVDAPADHLADIATVLGDAARMRTDEVRQRLAELNPGEYREWTAQDLSQFLESIDAAPYKSGGRMVVSRARITEALTERAAEQAEAANADSPEGHSA